MESDNPRILRSVFISDVHLGTRGCQAERLLDFIRGIACERLYLVGDIVDGWRLKDGWYWPQSHNDVVQKVLRMARKGTKVCYLAGNHDRFVLDFLGVHFGGVEVAREVVHHTADGRALLVTHGDLYEPLASLPAWQAWLGDWGYRALVKLNRALNFARRLMGIDYWSLSAWLKRRAAAAVKFVDRFETALAAEARRRGLDGVICGHLHIAAMRDIEGVLYVNDGDWVESCTALVEHLDGRLELIEWAQEPQTRAAKELVPA